MAETAKPAAAPVALAPPPGQRYAFEDQTATSGGFSAKPRQASGPTDKTGA